MALQFLEDRNQRIINEFQNMTPEEKERLKVKVELQSKGEPYTEEDVDNIILARKGTIEGKVGEKLYRFESLSPEDQRQIQQSIPNVSFEHGIQYIEKTGQLHPEALASLVNPYAKKAVLDILKKLPTREEALLKYLKKQKDVDPATLSNEELKNRLEAQTDLNQPKEAIDVTSQLLNAKKAKAEKEANIENFISGIPEQLRGGREQFLKGEEERAYGELERQVPLVLQNLNARGMLFSGEVEDALTTRALSLGSSLESIKTDLEEQDNQFYRDAAYRNALRKELLSSEDYKSAIAEKRGRIFTERGQRFRSSQQDLDRTLDEQLRRSDYERNLALQRSKLQRERDEFESRRRGELFGRIGEAGTRIGLDLATHGASEVGFSGERL